MSIEIVGLYTGEPKQVKFGDEDSVTGIYKAPVDGPLWLSFANLQGNDVANTKHHGGEARTLCVYPAEHYAHWNEHFGIELPPGAFGENLTLRGLTEEQVCIGDTYQVGEAVVQVTQARIPCKTIDLKLDVNGLFQQTALQAKSGYFFRTLQEGHIAKDSDVRLLERDLHGVTADFCMHTVYHDKKNADALRKILAVPALADNWRNMLQNLLEAAENPTSG
ncbi:MOSC domain-containing protein [Tumebacillus sp. ITR2]|uniref:MOSC domain-containing protein n=1 Tax=Tumebacillus amylolyticus TaxID=2801339 RepID=A0ABS1J628_9BACL|nr:MOSC domain-containing protein [Tumebacillus amylolyticus]MBL0385726.1 MOSC domain-containing protein [Tumebacillus amylolyticus]